MRQTTSDSRYTLLLGEMLLEKHTWDLSASFRLPLDPNDYATIRENGYPYQVMPVAGRVYYGYPWGSSVLSLPLIFALKPFGYTSHRADWSYDPDGDDRFQRLAAALLMAALGALFFMTARLYAPRRLSVFLALAGALTTPVWSTASRALWSDTWGILLLALAIYVLATEHRGSKNRIFKSSWLAGSLLAWMFFVRPTYAIPAASIAAYRLWMDGRRGARTIGVAALWMAGFVWLSWSHFGMPLHPYYLQGSELAPGNLPGGLAGVLVSPSRGLVVFMPILLCLPFLYATRARAALRHPLVMLALANVAGLVALTAVWPVWWGGYAYGPRLLTGLVPWLFLLAAIAISCGTTPARKRVRSHLEHAGALALVAAGFFIHARGAIDPATWDWNTRLAGEGSDAERVWQWREPQFLAGLDVPWSGRDAYPPYAIGSRIDFGRAASDAYLGRGWAPAESGFRWSLDRRAAIRIAPSSMDATQLRIAFMTHMHPGGSERRRVRLSINGRRVGEWTINSRESRTENISIPPNALGPRTEIVIETPDARSPRDIGEGNDPRVLGIGLQWLEIHGGAQ